jgi:hypothetical protein
MMELNSRHDLVDFCRIWRAIFLPSKCPNLKKLIRDKVVDRVKSFPTLLTLHDLKLGRKSYRQDAMTGLVRQITFQLYFNFSLSLPT